MPRHLAVGLLLSLVALPGPAPAQDSTSTLAMRDCSDMALRPSALVSPDTAAQRALETVPQGRILSQAWAWQDTLPVMSFEIMLSEFDTVEVRVDPRSGRPTRPRRVHWDEETRAAREACAIPAGGLGAGVGADPLSEMSKPDSAEPRDSARPGSPPRDSTPPAPPP
jgi:hypothetical protein